MTDWAHTLLSTSSLRANEKNGRSTKTESHALPHEEVPIAEIRSDLSLNSRSGDLDVTDLSESMASIGLMQPVVVTREVSSSTNGEEKTKYRLVAGFRRLAAATNLGWKTIPVVIVDADVEQARLYNLAENLARKDLRLYDTMRTVYDLSDKRGIQTGRIARETGMKESRAATMIKVWPKLAPSLKEKWAQIRVASWEPTMHQLKQWSSLSPPEQNREWSKWSNDADDPGTEFDEEDPYPEPEAPKRQCHKRRRTAALRGMIEALAEEKTEIAKAQIRALLWALGERNTL